MSNLETVLKETQTWPEGDQIELLERLWDRLLDAGWEPGVSDELKAEVDRRAAEIDANPENAVGWESIIQYVRRPR